MTGISGTVFPFGLCPHIMHSASGRCQKPRFPSLPGQQGGEMDFCESDVLLLGSDLEDSNIKKQVLFFLTEGGCIWFGAHGANCPVSVQEGDRASPAQSRHIAWALFWLQASSPQDFCELPKSLTDVLSGETSQSGWWCLHSSASGLS